MKEPYYAVIFTSVQKTSIDGYTEMAELMAKLASKQEGYLGMESARNKVGITVSYWKDLDSIKKWKQHTDHLLAQKRGREDWYAFYKVEICKVEHHYEFHS